MLSAVRAVLLRLVLRVPVLHRTVSRRFLLLDALGGEPVSPPTPVRYAVHESDVIALAPSHASWWRGLSAGDTTPARVRWKGREREMTATLAAGEALDEAVLRYLQKYPGEWRALGIDASATPEDVAAAAHASAVVLLREP